MTYNVFSGTLNTTHSLTQHHSDSQPFQQNTNKVTEVKALLQ